MKKVYVIAAIALAMLSIGQASYCACTCAAGCSSTTAISSGFVYGGAGEFCWTAADLGTYVMSWGVDVLQINGVDISNKYIFTNALLRDSTGVYYIYYKASGAGGHFEATGPSVSGACGTCTHSWCSAEQWGTVNMNGYFISNDIWGGTPTAPVGPQCIWADSEKSWGVRADHPNTNYNDGGGIKSYPHVGMDINKNISTMGTTISTFSFTPPSTGIFNAAYDIWVPNEVMIWMYHTPGTGPIAKGWDSNGNAIPSVTNVTVGGHTWDVYYGGAGVTSFVRQGNITSGSVDIKACLDWAKAQGYIGDGPVKDIEFGFEITGSAGGLDWLVSDFSIGSGGTAPTDPPSVTPEPTAAPIVTPAPAGSVLKGDANGNGTIDIVDALVIAQYYVGLNPSGFVSQASDVNCSGAADIVDALLVAQYYVGLAASFPC